jgi:response regulator of citrate/malate metabolism
VIRVLIVEDEPVAAAAHRAYVERVPGFEVVAVVGDGRSALRALQQDAPDLVLLDFHLPDMHGLAICQAMRAAGVRSEVIAVTSVRDLESVRRAVSYGVLQYVIKPFTFRQLRDKLERYAEFAGMLQEGGDAAAQSQVDGVFAALRGVDSTALPSGLAEETLAVVTGALQRSTTALSAREVAESCGLSRVTARRYLEHLAEAGLVRRAARYGGAGRPEVQYVWLRGRTTQERPRP